VHVVCLTVLSCGCYRSPETSHHRLIHPFACARVFSVVGVSEFEIKSWG
jgi:hypothetical protein